MLKGIFITWLLMIIFWLIIFPLPPIIDNLIAGLLAGVIGGYVVGADKRKAAMATFLGGLLSPVPPMVIYVIARFATASLPLSGKAPTLLIILGFIGNAIQNSIFCCLGGIVGSSIKSGREINDSQPRVREWS